jgi:3-methylfumaryl-CoA hydratase
MRDLGQDDFSEGDPLPRGWQFILLAADSRRSEIRPDGFPGLGVPMPDLGLPRLLLGGRNVRYHRNIMIGDSLTRRSRIQKVVKKASQNGPMAIVTIEHELCPRGTSDPSLVEIQTYILMGGSPIRGNGEDAIVEPPAGATPLVPDDLLLFQYSALGFNSHKIHIDRSYARETEGFPDLVVNGGLATLLLTEHFRHHCRGEIGSFTTRHLSPLFCGRPIFITVDNSDDGWHLCVLDDRGTKAVEMFATAGG